jgi:YVTN family beta-propeller protein
MSMTRVRRTLPLLVLGAVLAAALVPLAQKGPAPPERPGLQPGHVTLLPNGWRIAPAGTHMQAGDFPLAMTASPDGRFLIVTNNGYVKPTLTIVDMTHWYITEREVVDHAFLGLAWHPDGTRLFSSGGSQNTVNVLKWSSGRLEPLEQITISAPERTGGWSRLENAGFVAGIAMHPDGRTLYAVQVLGQALVALDVERSVLAKKVELEAEPYAVALSKDAGSLFVSLWGGAKVLVFDAVSLELLIEIPVGEHPNAMMLSADGARLFVACASTNAVWVIDVASRTAKEQIAVALYPQAPVGTTPNALALSPEGKTLLVANADNNTVAVVDIEDPARSEVEGFIPTGWYPTAVAFDKAGANIFVLSGKGLTGAPNPRGPAPGHRGMDGSYTGSMLQGALSVLPVPDKDTLAALTKRVYSLTRYSDAQRLAPPEAPKVSPIPARVGDDSPIEHVFYVIRENRTYDQVFGDLPKGNGDPNLVLFGEEVTPNAHALANEFVLLDNFYVDAEVSYDGHAFSTGAYATDIVEKMWPTNYGGRGGLYLSEGQWKMRTPYGNISAPPKGYLWDFATRAGVSVRSYGEFAYWEKKGDEVKASVPGLEGRVSPTYPPYDMSIADNERIDRWLEEFREFEKNGNLPRLNIVRLGNDHTAGTRPGDWTPRSMVAENDLALGRFVEAISKSRYWKESAIFVLEDDAQNGPDHVDSHRSVALVVSPFTKRRAVDSTLYTTSAMLRTIELILGLEPMSQYDAAATPMYNAFQNRPDLTPYTHRPARVPIDQRNDWNSYGAQASLDMYLDEADLAPELELNEILWKSVKGAHSQMPPPRRAAFIRSVEGDDEEEERRP